MYSPARAILWQIFRRNQWGFVAAALYLLFAIVTSHLLTPYARTHWGDAGVAFVGLYLGAPCALIMVLVIAVFCLSGNRLGESTPPAHMLVLPVTSRMLVSVPMVAGAVTVVAVWLIVAMWVLRPADISAPLMWPVAVLVLFLTIFQAIAWTPFAQKWMQALLTMAAGAGTFGWVLGGIAFGFMRFETSAEPLIATASIAVLVPLAYLVGLSGVAMTRRGDAYDWRWWSRLMERTAAWRKPSEHPFSSASAAQIWFECRTVGWFPPLMTLGTGFFMLFMLLDDPTDMTQTWKYLGMFASLPLIIVTMAGGTLGGVNGLSANSPQGQFLFVRPLSSGALVRDKMWTAAIVSLGCWLVIAPFSLLFLLRPGFVPAVVELMQRMGAWRIAVFTPLTFLFVLAVTWKQLVENFWVSLTGRTWLINLFVFGMIATVFLAVGGGIWLNLNPDYQPAARVMAPRLLLVAVVAKLLISACVLVAMLRSPLLPNRFTWMMLGGWCLIVGGLIALSLWKIPPGLVPIGHLVGGVLLLMPFSRLVVMPLALEWNRHR